MLALALLTCVLLRAFTAQARVIDDFNGCKHFFYRDTEPGGMDQNAKKICQVYGQGEYRQCGEEEYIPSYYATLYSTRHRIPLYSAYTFDPACTSDSGRKDIWHVEPQLSGYPNINMVLERDLRNLGLDKDVIKGTQAVSSDYRGSGYDRGHLNPNSFSCGAGRTATFTLTNAAPMNPRFNQRHWRNWEGTLRRFLGEQLDRDDGLATVYIVTGTVPNANVRTPQRGNSEDNERVTVPSHIWTAVCYKHQTDEGKSLSFGYMAENQPEERAINPTSVSDLNNQISRLYSELSGTQQTVTIFADDCFGDNNKLNMVKEKLKGKLHMSTVVQTTYDAVQKAISSDSQSSEKSVLVKEMTTTLAFDSMNTYYTTVEDLKVSAGSACLITHVKPLVSKTVHDELRKRDVSEASDAVECLLVPMEVRTTADGSQCSSVSESSASCLCISGGETKRCCSSPCLYQGKLEGYWCYSGQTLIPCSPRYSLITAKGERCKDDHPCATYGEKYYWCYKVSGGWDYCSPPLWSSKAKDGKPCRSDHACAKYGSRKPWCYTDDQGNNDRCCTSDDCFSAVNSKTCRSDHKCGYHGETYLWCYTDQKNNKDYCCTNCG